MLTALRRAWKKYLESLPQSEEEPLPMSDAANLRQLHPPLPNDVQHAFGELARELAAHLAPERATKAVEQLERRIGRPGVTPNEALVHWIASHAGPRKANLGIIALDWKARDEIVWQAKRLASAHRVPCRWNYDYRSDTSWQGWQSRGEFPVSLPLRNLGAQLRSDGLALFVIAHDDTVGAFATRVDCAVHVKELCGKLEIWFDQ